MAAGLSAPKVDPSAGTVGAPVSEADREARMAGAPLPCPALPCLASNLRRVAEVDSCLCDFGKDWGRMMLGLGRSTIGGEDLGDRLF
jgi:hypothetical protein